MTFRSNIGDENGEVGNLKLEDDRGILDPLNTSQTNALLNAE
jgi:hypothetical protein